MNIGREEGKEKPSFFRISESSSLLLNIFSSRDFDRSELYGRP